jgi:hypothetical protein
MLGLVLATLVTQLQPLRQPAATPSAGATMLAQPPSAPLSTPSPVAAMPTPTQAGMSVPPHAAVIRNSGSTNTVGYSIVLSHDGRAVISQDGRNTTAVLASPQTNWLFAKLREAGPLSALPVGHCMRSVSFGSSTTISYEGATSPDLSCAVSPLESELARTVGVIVRQLNISTLPTHRLRPL